MGQLLYFYYIEAHTDRVVATAFCTALYARWVEKKRRQSASASHMISPKPNDGSMGILMPPGMHPSQVTINELRQPLLIAREHDTQFANN